MKEQWRLELSLDWTGLCLTLQYEDVELDIANKPLRQAIKGWWSTYENINNKYLHKGTQLNSTI